jgi:hypothetical protein
VQVESGGNCNARGASGEGGCYQFLVATWERWSNRVLGYVAPMTPVNEEYVALYKIQQHLDEGYNEAQIALIWNQGHAGPCKAGTNSKGIEYNSCAYRDKVLVAMR